MFESNFAHKQVGYYMTLEYGLFTTNAPNNHKFLKYKKKDQRKPCNYDKKNFKPSK